MIQVEQLTRDYGTFRAVDRITFSVPAGTTFGFLGPNGAGKTTTIKMLCTLLAPTSGSASVAGYDVVKEPMNVRQSLGIIFQDPTLDDRLTAYENLKFHGILYGRHGPDLEKQIGEMLELVGLSDKREALVRTFSGGMKRRLELARGLIHTPKILFLDEPTIGLDPQTRVHLWDYLAALKKEGELTLFLTTHYLEEAENCDQIAIIDHGKIVAMDTPARLKSQIEGTLIFLKTEDDEKTKEFLKNRYQLTAEDDEGGIVFEVSAPEKWLPNFLRDSPIPVLKLNLHRPSLEDVFIHLTGREIREEEGSWLGTARALMRKSR